MGLAPVTVLAASAQPLRTSLRRAALGSGTAGDRRTELALGAVASLVLVLCASMVVFVVLKAWPSFASNGLGWFSSAPTDTQLADIYRSPAKPDQFVYEFGAWSLIWGTILTSGVAVLIGVVFALFTAIFIVEFAPPNVNRVLVPTVRLLAAVPSVVYGLIGILVLVPLASDLFVTNERKESVAYFVQINGACWSVAAIILAVMIVPIMISIIVDALRAVPRSWTEGAAALGVNRWRVVATISVRAARPAIIAGMILATARALGEAIMLSMVAGSAAFGPNPLDGFTFFLEPVRPLAATVVESAEGLSVTPFGQTIYAVAALLLLSSAVLSVGGWFAKRSMRKYGIEPGGAT